MKETVQLIFVFSGIGVKNFFLNEIGNHRFQRIPPTETNGRMHTSTVSVAVLDEKEDIDIDIDYDEIEFFYTRGTGNGGQHKNTTNSCVVARHKKTGIEVRIDGRNQYKNKEDAYKELKRRLLEKEKENYNNNYSNERIEQIGISNRTNKRRTYNLKTDIVKDHITGRKTSYKNIQKGKINLLHD